MAGNQSSSPASTAANRLARLGATFRAVRLEHLMAGITGGVVSTLVLHPLDLLKIRFAGKFNDYNKYVVSIYQLIVLNLLRILNKHIFIFLILVDDGKIQNRPQYRGLFHAFTSIFKQEGATGLYKGVSPNVFGAGAAWGSYFLLYVLIDNIL